jgi:hypothetical protein
MSFEFELLLLLQPFVASQSKPTNAMMVRIGIGSSSHRVRR